MLGSHIHDFTYSSLEAELSRAGFKPVHARALWRALYRDLATPSALSQVPSIPPPLRRWLDHSGVLRHVPEEVAFTESSDGSTQKFLLKMRDAQTIETVVMGYDARHTACVSTQAGCAMGCVFCATGQMGFIRHLQTAEIVSQVIHAQSFLRSRNLALRNIVLMGMGEPLHNYDAVMGALEIISDTRGLNLGPRRITISTVGIVPGILRMVEEEQPWHLAVSLHAASDSERTPLIPVNARWPLSELMDACRIFSTRSGRKIFFEWTLIDGINDTADHAKRLAALIQGILSHVNLIPLNPTRAFDSKESSLASIALFQRTLRAAGIPSTVRQRRGIDVSAGCGQLRAARGERNAFSIK